MPNIDLSILNQRQTPAFFADTFANRPAASFVGRVFISTDTYDLYRDTGSAWVLLSPSSTAGVTGSGSNGSIALWNGTDTITYDVNLLWDGTENSLTANKFVKAGGTSAQILAADGSSITAGTNITISGGTISASGGITGSGAINQVAFFSGASAITGENNLFWDSTNNHFGINTNTPGTSLDVHHDQSTIAILNQTIATNDARIGFQNNGVGLWRIGAFYNAGSNDFAIFDAVNSLERFSVKNTGQTFVGSQTTTSGRFVVNSAVSDNHIVVIGANAPSLRINNAGTGATQQIGFGISTAANNFIQGSVNGDMCVFNSNTTASPILFGVFNGTNTQEAARVSAARNFLVGGIVDSGEKLQVSGTALITGVATFNSSINANSVILKNSGVPAAQLYRDLDVTIVGSAGQGIEFGARSGSTYISGAAVYGGLDNPATSGNLVFQTLNGGTLGTRLTIASAGQATFSNTITATSLIKSGGTSSEILAADGSVITAGTGITISGGTISSSGGSGVTGSGTIGTIPLWFGATDNIGNSQITQATSNIFIGGSYGQTAKLNVAGDIDANGNIKKNGTTVLNVSTFTIPMGNLAVGQTLVDSSIIDDGNNVYIGTATFVPRALLASAQLVMNGSATTTNTINSLYLTSCAGIPTTAPSTYTNKQAIMVDRTNFRLYVYVGGSWRYAALV
jgi:hypothetical protein